MIAVFKQLYKSKFGEKNNKYSVCQKHKTEQKQQIEALLMQLIWIIILALFGNLLWHMGKKKLVVQGG